jgi:pyrimidine-specific ribonucleoside hydrolase
MLDKIKTHLDIETGDPDDLWTLALMATHPRIDLLGVTVFPGGRDQIGLVRKVLNLLGKKSVLIGANVKQDTKERVSPYYSKWLGDIKQSDPDMSLLDVFKITKGHNLLTGGPLSNVEFMRKSSPDKIFHHWTCQGGFVGNNIIPEKDALEKFRGMDCVQTFNLNGDPKGAANLLGVDIDDDTLFDTGYVTNQFDTIRMVGKNVCHGFVFDKSILQTLPKGKHDGLDLMISGIEQYYKQKTDPKAMHDILAALMFIYPEYGIWVKGAPFRKKGKWGFSDRYKSNIQALIGLRGIDLQELL